MINAFSFCLNNSILSSLLQHPSQLQPQCLSIQNSISCFVKQRVSKFGSTVFPSLTSPANSRHTENIISGNSTKANQETIIHAFMASELMLTLNVMSPNFSPLCIELLIKLILCLSHCYLLGAWS